MAQEGGPGSLGRGEANRLPLQGICSLNPLVEPPPLGWQENPALEGNLLPQAGKRTRPSKAVRPERKQPERKGLAEGKKARACRRDNLTPGLAFELVSRNRLTRPPW